MNSPCMVIISMSLTSPLIQAYCDHPDGLCGQREPAEILNQIRSVEERLSILAFGVVADAGQSNFDRWGQFAAVHDHWLFNPSQAAYKTSTQIQDALQQLSLKVPKHIARVWWQISRGVQGRTKGSWPALIEANQKDALQLLTYLQKSKATFPVLSGPTLSVHWLDLVQRVGGVTLTGWESLRVPLTHEYDTEAHLFGITSEEVHPVVISALRVWKQACQKGHGIPCGLAGCPRT